MKDYFVFSTSQKFTKEKADRISERIKAIDSKAEFHGPLSIPGSQTTGWIVRPDDGTNNQSEISARNQRMANIAREELGVL